MTSSCRSSATSTRRRSPRDRNEHQNFSLAETYIFICDSVTAIQTVRWAYFTRFRHLGDRVMTARADTRNAHDELGGKVSSEGSRRRGRESDRGGRTPQMGGRVATGATGQACGDPPGSAGDREDQRRPGPRERDGLERRGDERLRQPKCGGDP